MKIFAVGRNYVDHIEELKNDVPDNPVVFSKPETALIRRNRPFYIPDFSDNIQHEIEIVIRICKHGKNIAEKFAHKYYDQFALGIDFTARDLQTTLKEKGLPWDLAKGFDGSAPISGFFPVSEYNLQKLDFSLKKNGKTVQSGNTSYMLYSFDYIVSFVSKYFTLKKGDYIFTGTPKGVGRVSIGDRLEGFIEDKNVLTVAIK